MLKLYAYRAIKMCNENENVYEKYVCKQRHPWLFDPII